MPDLLIKGIPGLRIPEKGRIALILETDGTVWIPSDFTATVDYGYHPPVGRAEELVVVSADPLEIEAK